MLKARRPWRLRPSYCWTTSRSKLRNIRKRQAVDRSAAFVVDARLLCVGTVALLELLAGTTRAGIVATDLFARDPRSVAVGRRSRSHGTGLVKLTLLLALELALERVDGGRWCARRDWNGSMLLWCCLRRSRRKRRLLASGRRRGGWCAGEARRKLVEAFNGRAVGTDDLHAEEVPRRVLLEAEHHSLEHLEGLLLVRDQRVLLSVAAQADALLEVVHLEEMVLPQAVEHAEHHDTLVVAHRLRTEDLFLDLVAVAQLFEDGLSQLVPVQAGDIDLFLPVNAELVVELRENRLGIPLVRMRLLRRVLVENVREDRREVVISDQLLLVDALHQLAAQTVDGLALLVHHVVVLEDVL